MKGGKMKKRKGILIIALISMMATFFLTGCGEAEQEASTSSMSSTSQSSYTITFDSDGGRKVQNQVKQGNELLEEPDLVYKIVHNDGEYELEGWYFGEIKWDFDTMTVEGDMVLKARWNKVEDYPKPEI
jgi:maltose-binding protein MalE